MPTDRDSPGPTLGLDTTTARQADRNLLSSTPSPAGLQPSPGPRRLVRRGILVTGCCLLLISLPGSTRAAVMETWRQQYRHLITNSWDVAVDLVSDSKGDFLVTGRADNGFSWQTVLLKYSGGDGTVLWEHRARVYQTALAMDPRGDVIVTGYVSVDNGTDCYTAKLAGADGALLWEQTYNGPGNYIDQAVAVAVDSSGNVIVAGRSFGIEGGPGFGRLDYYTAKYAAEDGALLWEKRYNGPAHGSDEARAVAVDGEGNVLVTGSSFGGETHSDFYTAKYAGSDGALLWEIRYTGPGFEYDSANAIAVDPSGNVVVTGTSFGGETHDDYYTAKYAGTNGELLWERRYDSPGNGVDSATALAVDAHGDVVVTGNYTVKHAAADGVVLWENRSGSARAVVLDASNDVAVAGSTGGNASGSDYYTAKYAGTDGTLLWEHRYDNSAAPDEVQAVAVDREGHVAVTGFSINSDGDADFYTAKYGSADGALVWETRYHGPPDSRGNATAVAVDPKGDVVATGSSYSGDGNDDFYTAKYSGISGALLWDHRYNGPESIDDWARAVAVDRSGHVVVTGHSGGIHGNGDWSYDYYTAKYAGANGALLWERRYNGPARTHDLPWAVAVDTDENVVVTGQSWNGSNDDFYTAKYAGADGSLLWEKRYNGPGNGSDVAWGLAVDSSGSVLVTGNSVGMTGGSDCYTAKYAAANGDLLWEKRYDGPAHGSDASRAVAVDGQGNVVVTGYSDGGPSGTDYYTAKYAAADGALLWEKRYNGPGNASDDAVAVALDAGGHVVVTGSSVGSASGSDYYTARYAAADGALLWEKRYAGSANREDYASAVAVDSNGDVVVTGSSNESAGSPNVRTYTAKYAGSDGSLLWEKLDHGPAHGTASLTSLALGSHGMVVLAGQSNGDFATDPYHRDFTTVVCRERLPPIAIDRRPAGVSILFTGIAGFNYAVERAPAVAGPWSPIATSTTSTSDLIDFLDTEAPAGTAFYRVRAW